LTTRFKEGLSQGKAKSKDYRSRKHGEWSGGSSMGKKEKTVEEWEKEEQAKVWAGEDSTSLVTDACLRETEKKRPSVQQKMSDKARTKEKKPE